MKNFVCITSLFLLIGITSFVCGQTPALDALKSTEVPNMDSGSFPGWGWVLIFLALAASGVAIALALAARRREEPAPEPEEEEPEPATPEPEEEEEEPAPAAEEEEPSPPAPAPGPAGGAAALILAGLTSLFFITQSVLAGPKTDFINKLKDATVEAGTMAKNADQKASKASQDAGEAKKSADEAIQKAKLAEEQAAMARQEIQELQKKSGGGTTTVVRSSGSGHDVTARLANWRLATAIYLAGGDDLATAKAKASKFVTNPKGNENELWKSAATVREKVRETGLDLSAYATTKSLEAEARARAEGDRSLEAKIPNIDQIAKAVATALANDGFVARPELDAKLTIKADRSEVEGLLSDVKNISQELSAKADSVEVDEIKTSVQGAEEKVNLLAAALVQLAKAEEEPGKVKNLPVVSSLAGLLGRDRKVKKSPEAESDRQEAMAKARALLGDRK